VKEIKNASKEKRAVVQSVPKYSLKTGRPLMLGEIDKMVQTYIKAVSTRGGLVTRTLANATAKVEPWQDILSWLEISMLIRHFWRKAYSNAWVLFAG